MSEPLLIVDVQVGFINQFTRVHLKISRQREEHAKRVARSALAKSP